MCLRASLPSNWDSVHRDFDNQASYLSIAQAYLVNKRYDLGKGALLRPSDKNNLLRYPVYMYVKRPFFIILVHFILHTKLLF